MAPLDDRPAVGPELDREPADLARGQADGRGEELAEVVVAEGGGGAGGELVDWQDLLPSPGTFHGREGTLLYEHRCANHQWSVGTIVLGGHQTANCPL